MSYDDKGDNERPFWLREPCPPWCDGLHDDHDCVEDRRHQNSLDTYLALSTMEPIRHDCRHSGGEVYYNPHILQVRIDQGYRETEPRVHLEEARLRGQFSFTFAEAEEIASALIEAVTLGRKPTS